MKPCPEYHEAITLLAARALKGTERERIERHVASCQACRNHLERLQQMCGELERMPQQIPASEVSEGFHQRLVDRIRTDAKASPARVSPTVSWLREWFSLPRLAYAAAVVILLAGAVLWIDRGDAGRDQRMRISSVSSEPVASTPAPTLMVLSRALQESEAALDSLLARQEQVLAANGPPTSALARNDGVVW